MARIDQLPADQKAVLQLLLKQGKTYEDLATLLRISPDAVRDRALTALDALGPDDPDTLSEEHQDEVSDFLLGQQTASQRANTREFLEGSAAGRAWARVVAGELRPLAGDALPEIPAEGVELDEAFDALDARQRARVQRDRSSRFGGVLLLVGLGLVVAVLAILLIGGLGGDDDDKQAERPATTPTTATTSTTTQVEAQINLTAAQPGSKALGVANIVSQGNERAIALIGQDLAPSPRYVVWLYNSADDAQFLGFAPPVPSKGQNKGRLQGLAPAPDNLDKFKELIVTREKVNRPSKPGTIVLRGRLKSA